MKKTGCGDGCVVLLYHSTRVQYPYAVLYCPVQYVYNTFIQRDRVVMTLETLVRSSAPHAPPTT